MTMPLYQSLRLGSHPLNQKLLKRSKVRCPVGRDQWFGGVPEPRRAHGFAHCTCEPSAALATAGSLPDTGWVGT